MSLFEIVGLAANVLVAFAAIAALFLARQQVAISREISALEAYEEYHKFAIEYPEFCVGPDPYDLSEKDLFRYVYFVLYILMVAERIYLSVPKSSSWDSAIEGDVRIHKKVISSSVFEKYLQQEWAIAHLISKVLAE